MKYMIWFVRLLFGAWMIPAGINHFIPLFPQPMGSQPLSHELIVALIDSHLFDLVKLVELLAGVAVLIGIHAPLGVLICVPISFCVFWWDAPLEGYGSRAARFGIAVLLGNAVLAVAWIRNYASMLAPRTKPALLLARLAFGAWLLASGINHFFFQLWPEPSGQQALAAQLLAAFDHSGLLDVAMLIKLACGALLLAGLFVPLALCVTMPVMTCTLYWALVLEHHPGLTALALGAFALNALLMFAHIEAYRPVLQRSATTLGEMAGGRAVFDTLFARVGGRSARPEFVLGLLTLLAAVGFYAWLVPGRTGLWSMLMLVYPGVVLHARRLREMRHNPWLVAIPAGLLLAAFATWLGYLKPGEEVAALLPPAALAVAGAFSLWGCIGSGRR